MLIQSAPTFPLEQALDRHPLTVAPHANLDKVIELMGQTSIQIPSDQKETDGSEHPLLSELHSSCVLVLDQSQLVGILTERDIVKLIAEHQSLADLTMASVMSEQVITLQAEETLNIFSALNLMHRHRIRHLPVVDEQGQVLGLLTPKGLRSLLVPADMMKLRQVHEVMNSKVIHAFPKESVLQLTQKMTQNRVSCIVLVEATMEPAEVLRPIGIITERDIVQFQRLGLNLAQTQVQTVMSTPLSLISPEDSLWSVHKKMQHHRVRRLVVADRQGHLQGIVTQSNLLPVDPAELYEVLALLQQEVSQLKIEKEELLLLRNQELENLTQEQALELQYRATERRQTAQVLRHSEQEYRTLAENLPGIVYRVFPEEQNRMVFLNSQCQTLTGFTPDDLAAGAVCSIDPLIIPEDRPYVIATVQEAVSRQQPFLVEYRIKDRAGQIRYFWEKGQPISAMNGHPPYIDGVIFDVTERKQAELAQLESQQRLNSILESLEDVIWSVSSDFCELLYLSPVAENIYGRSTAEFYDNPKLRLQVVHPDDQSRVRDFDQVLLEIGSNTCEYRIVRPDGVVRWILDRAKVIYDADGVAIRLDGVATDITDRKFAQQKIRDQAALLDVATDAILVRAMNNQILFWNKGAETLYGWTAEEAIDQDANQLLYPSAFEENEEIQACLIRQGNWKGERQQVTKTGQEITVMSRWTLVQDQQDHPKFILTVNTDITEAKQLESQFLRAQRLESIGTLASGISHDLNNVLTPIYGVAQLLPLLLPNASDQIQRQFEIIQTSAKRGTDIIQQVLSFSRGSEGEYAPLNIKHLISEIRSFTHRTFSKSVEISINLSDDLWSVMGDATQLYQVFMNLFVNARDAMPNGGCLNISARNQTLDPTFVTSYNQVFSAGSLNAQTGAYILLLVSDTGIGIPEEQLDSIFEPFFTTKQSQGGTGLGLSTVYKIIQSHGGFIDVQSQLNQGTQFRVYLPAIEAEEVAEEETHNYYPSGQGELILVVDDEAVIREVAQSILESHNYRVLVAVDGKDAISLYADHKTEISAVITDIEMPTLSGTKVIATLQKLNPQLRVIIASGLPVNEQITASTGECVKVLLQKPYSSADLLQTLHRVLENETRRT